MPKITKPKPRDNGRMLTVKQLDRRSYNAVHKLPRGLRGPVMKALLKLFADYLETHKGIAATDVLRLLKNDAKINVGT